MEAVECGVVTNTEHAVRSQVLVVGDLKVDREVHVEEGVPVGDHDPAAMKCIRTVMNFRGIQGRIEVPCASGAMPLDIFRKCELGKAEPSVVGRSCCDGC
jgi:hypothetical protein